MNNASHLLSAAQFAELCDVKKSTLRFYRDRGILMPERVQENGYGKYGPMQGLDVAHIRFLESCGFGLREIEDGDRHLFTGFPYERVLATVEREQRGLAAKKAMLSVASLISAAAEAEDRRVALHSTEAKHYLFLEYRKPSDDIEYNLIHSIKLITRLSLEHLGVTPFVLGRVIAEENLRSGNFQKVKGLVIPIPEDIAMSGGIPEENLLRTEESVTVRMCYNGEPYSYREPYEQISRHIRENGLEIRGGSIELWTIGSRAAGSNTYATLIDVPVR